MAEGLIRKRYADRVHVFSAGAAPADRVHPGAVAALAERGIDISAHVPKSTDTFLGQNFDFVITTCDSARDVCPVFPGRAQRLHWGLQDPASAAGAQHEIDAVFRATAQALEQHIETLDEAIAAINKAGS
jgi:arsenate reductase